jgi:hypothetical protein
VPPWLLEYTRPGMVPQSGPPQVSDANSYRVTTPGGTDATSICVNAVGIAAAPSSTWRLRPSSQSAQYFVVRSVLEKS